MCGIIGYIGKRNTIDVLLKGLYSLEYRGYDSAGICISDNNKQEIIRSVGRVSNLEDKVKEESKVNSTFGIAHTRWATNGEACEKNAHPHKVGKVTIVHNGIIENADVLKEELIKEGYKFNSETDTEVAAALLDKLLKGSDPIKAINQLTSKLIGSYAFGIIIDGEEKLYAVRKDSPLLIGIGDNEYFLASDITAIANFTKNYILLEENEIAVLTNNEYKIYKGRTLANKRVLSSDSDGFSDSKGGYEHYMMKEIMEEPIVIKRLVDKYKDDEQRKKLDLSKYKEIDIVGCGSAKYAGMIGQSLLEEFADIKTTVYSASEYRYKKKIYNIEKTLVIVISQSGETADTVAALREANELAIDTLGIVNNPNSTIARESDKTILIEAGVEVAVATTKAYLAQVCILALMAYETGINKNIIDMSYREFINLPTKIKEVIENKDSYRKIAKKIYLNRECFFIGRGLDYAISMEGSLKLKEVSYIHCEAYEAGELKHGTISLIEEDMPVFAIISDNRLKDKTISNLKETLARGAKGFIVTSKGIDIDIELDTITVPKSSLLTSAMLITPALQLMAYYTAKAKKCDIDKPRNLAKSVTVE